MEEVREERDIQIAKSMHEKGVSIDKIAFFMDTDVSYIEELLSK